MAQIRHWLHMEPADDLAVFADQAAQVEWLEKRHYETLGKIFAGPGGKGKSR